MIPKCPWGPYRTIPSRMELFFSGVFWGSRRFLDSDSRNQIPHEILRICTKFHREIIDFNR